MEFSTQDIFDLGPEDAQTKVEAHHTAVLNDGDYVIFENKVGFKENHNLLC